MAAGATPPSGPRGHRQREHTADLAFEAWAPSEAELLVEAARALVEVLSGGVEIAARDSRPVALAALDPENRLVRWLNDVLFWAIHEGFFLSDARLELAGNGLAGTARGEAGATERLRTEVKSVTYHGLRLEERPEGWRCEFVVDV